MTTSVLHLVVLGIGLYTLWSRFGPSRWIIPYVLWYGGLILLTNYLFKTCKRTPKLLLISAIVISQLSLYILALSLVVYAGVTVDVLVVPEVVDLGKVRSFGMLSCVLLGLIIAMIKEQEESPAVTLRQWLQSTTLEKIKGSYRPMASAAIISVAMFGSYEIVASSFRSGMIGFGPDHDISLSIVIVLTALIALGEILRREIARKW